MRGLAVLLAIPLSGCFAVYVPGSAIDTAGGRPTYCVADTAKVGDRLNIGGTVYEVTKLSGSAAYFCREQPEGRRMGAEARKV